MTTEYKLYDKVVIEENCISYSLNDEYHRTDGPAYIGYYQDGSKYSEHYCINGKYHRTDGPAIIQYYNNGSIDYELYFLNDKALSQPEFEKQCKTITK